MLFGIPLTPRRTCGKINKQNITDRSFNLADNNSIPKEIKNEMVYLASVDLLRRMLDSGEFEKEMLDRLNRKNAETMKCRVVDL